MKRLGMVVAVFVAVAGLTQAGAKEMEPKPEIQVAILLDTSGSMSGLINQARTQLWKIVNEFAATKKDGKTPDLQVALFEYGNSRLQEKDGYIRQVVPLSTDLDKVSEDLFALTTSGGSEYCGAVIDVATRQLDWSGNKEALKAIFIAGNERFTQGSVDYRRACKAAIEKGIVVNTIHCGALATGISGKWKDGADLADGSYSAIDHNQQVAHVAAPQDAEIAKLGAELNETYVAYGQVGRKGEARQVAQDANAAKFAAEGARVQRAVAKSSVHYKNASWDLVDAVKNGKVELSKVKEEELPEDMRAMDDKEQKAHIEELAKKRAGIQARIKELDTARKKHIAAEMKKQSESGAETLDSAIIKAVRTHAEKNGFVVE